MADESGGRPQTGFPMKLTFTHSPLVHAGPQRTDPDFVAACRAHPAARTRREDLPMANIKSQKKRIRTNAKRAERNKAVRSELKTRVKRAQTTVGTDDNAEAVRMAVKRIDKAAAKGVIHPNAAARKKSRLMKQVNAAG